MDLAFENISEEDMPRHLSTAKGVRRGDILHYHEIFWTALRNNAVFIHNYNRLLFFKQDIPVMWEYAINNTYKNKSRHNFINNLS